MNKPKKKTIIIKTIYAIAIASTTLATHARADIGEEWRRQEKMNNIEQSECIKAWKYAQYYDANAIQNPGRRIFIDPEKAVSKVFYNNLKPEVPCKRVLIGFTDQNIFKSGNSVILMKEENDELVLYSKTFSKISRITIGCFVTCDKYTDFDVEWGHPYEFPR